MWRHRYCPEHSRNYRTASRHNGHRKRVQEAALQSVRLAVTVVAGRQEWVGVGRGGAGSWVVVCGRGETNDNAIPVL